MRIIEVLADAVLAVLRFFLRLLGLVLALVMVLFILGFVLIWTLLRLLSGRRPAVNVSAHFSRVRSFTDLGQTMRMRRSWGADRAAGQAALRHRPSDVEDVQARDLPADRESKGH